MCYYIIGGHTAEMLQLAQYLDPNKYTPRTYVMASSDALSASKVDPDEVVFFCMVAWRT